MGGQEIVKNVSKYYVKLERLKTQNTEEIAEYTK